MSKIILHLDLDAFFCRAEEIKNPSLEGKPFIVGGDGRKGIVSTCSYKAREYGIHSGMPTFQAKMLCKNILILPGDYHYYSLLSKEFINYLKRYSKKIQQMSIDECFLDLTEYYEKSGKKITEILKKIQNELFEKYKLKVSIGVGTTKFIAKMASDYKKPMGITIIRNRDIHKMLFPLPVKSFFGIGKKTVPKLNQLGIYTIGDLYNHCLNDLNEVNDVVGKFSTDIINELEGKSSDEVSTEFIEPKSIGMSRTLDYDTNNREVILQMLEFQIDNVVDSMIEQQMLTKTIYLVYKDAACDNDFKEKSFSHSLNNYTDNKELIRKEAISLFNKTYDGKVIRLIGFTVKNLKEKENTVVQMTFEDFAKHEKNSKSFIIMNELNREYNKPIFKKLSDLEK